MHFTLCSMVASHCLDFRHLISNHTDASIWPSLPLIMPFLDRNLVRPINCAWSCSGKPLGRSVADYRHQQSIQPAWASDWHLCYVGVRLLAVSVWPPLLCCFDFSYLLFSVCFVLRVYNTPFCSLLSTFCPHK